MGTQKARGAQQLTSLENKLTGSFQHLGTTMPAAAPCPLILALLREDSGKACGELALEPK